MFLFSFSKEYNEYKKLRGEMLMDRSNSLLLPFSFWGKPQPTDTGNLYELRSYHLRVGINMINMTSFGPNFIKPVSVQTLLSTENLPWQNWLPAKTSI